MPFARLIPPTVFVGFSLTHRHHCKCRRMISRSGKFDFRALLRKGSARAIAHANDPALGFNPLSGLRYACDSAHRRGLVTASIVCPWTGSRQPYPLVGFRRPSCADAIRICRLESTCTGLFNESRRRRPFSVFRGKRLADPSDRSSGGPASCLRFCTCR